MRHRGVDCNFQFQHGVSLGFAACCPCDSLGRAKVNYLANEAVEDATCVCTCSNFSGTFSQDPLAKAVERRMLLAIEVRV